jgi:hypothetical protein
MAAALTVRRINPDEHPAWDRFVAESPQGSVFGLSAYLDAFEVRRDIIVAKEGERIAAGMVLARNRLGLATNPLFVKHLGILFAPSAGSRHSRRERERHLAASLALAVRGIASFDYSFSPGFDDWLPLRWQGFRQETRYTYRLGPERGGAWRKSAQGRLRNDLLAAERIGVVAEAGGTVAELVDAVRATYRRRETRLPVDSGLLAARLEQLRSTGMLTIFLARARNGTVASAAALVADQKVAFLLLSGFHEGAPRGATALVVAHAIDVTLAEGRIFDFEGSMIRRIERFYRAFGGELVPYFRIWRPSVINGIVHLAGATLRRGLGYAR